MKTTRAQHLDKPGNEAELRPRPRYEAPEYRGSGKLQDRVAIITGGDSGIGRAVAVLFDYSATKGAIHAFSKSLAYVFLAASSCSSYITGIELPIMGGTPGA